MKLSLVLFGSLILLNSPLLTSGMAQTQQRSPATRHSSRRNSASSHSRRKTQTAPADSSDATSDPTPPTDKTERKVVGQRIRFVDGSTLLADDVWKQGDDLWYRSGGTSNLVTRPVRAIEPIRAAAKERPTPTSPPTPLITTTKSESKEAVPAFLIYTVSGARFSADEVNQTESGAWYRHANVTIFLDKDRIARIARGGEEPNSTGWKQRGWSSGNDLLDEVIKKNGIRFGVDPYLIFCVIEQESQFHARALSPKGARGLMQLMPGTAARYGVRNAFDPANNVFGGTQYLKQLLDMFSGRLDLALASYNAGEGAVLKHGGQVPPYKETREYVRRISKRYGAAEANKVPRQPATAGPDE